MIEDKDLISLLGIQDLPAEQKIRIVDQSARLIEDRLFLRLMKSLPDADQEKLNQILEKGDEVEIGEFISEKAPDYMKWVDEEILSLKQELSSLINQEL